MRPFIALAWTLTAVTASPLSDPVALGLEKRAPDCKAANAALTVIKALGPPATAFCSSYLRIPSATTVVTIAPTPTVTVSPTSTDTITATITGRPCPAIARRAEVEYTYERNGDKWIIAHPKKALEKRLNVPALSTFAAVKLSSGCSCLSLAPKTVLSTSTPPTQTVGAVATATACASTCRGPGGRCGIDTFTTDCCPFDSTGSTGCLFDGDVNNGRCM